jgi:hypothetical protein
MKRKSFIGAVAVGAFLVVFAGISQADGSGPTHKETEAISYWGDAETDPFTDSDFSNRSSNSEMEYWELNNLDTIDYWGPVETGTLPGSDKSSRLLDAGVDPARWEEPNAE